MRGGSQLPPADFPDKTASNPVANRHDAETRQFLALVNAERPGLAFALGAIRSRVAGIIVTGLLLLVASMLGVPQHVLAAVLSKLA